MRTLTVAVILLGGTASAAPRSKPTLEHGDATVSGDLDATALAKVVKRSSAKLLGCYKKALMIRPGLSGTATATFTIGADGKVATAETTGLITSAGACIAATITKIRFARPKDGQLVKVTYPLTFDPGAEGGAFASLTGTGDVGSGFDDSNIYGGLVGSEVGETTGGGGFDRSGFGPGGGGTGWGTIGTGRYGTIGKGGGVTGSGYGVGGGRGGMRGRTSDVPTVSIGQPDAQGDLDKAIIRRYIKRNIQKLQYCYEKELLQTPTLKGTVTAAFTIGIDGLVSSSTASGIGSTDVETCIAAVIKGIEFPKPKGNGPVTVKYPFKFQPADPPAGKK